MSVPVMSYRYGDWMVGGLAGPGNEFGLWVVVDGAI